jgi:hypothetical protein
MNADYKDIRSRIQEQPLWFDEHAVPRYELFKPELVADIYAEEAVLFLIECQACGKRYKVAASFSKCAATSDAYYMRELDEEGGLPDRPLADEIRHGGINYGDPPNACDSGCLAGSSMSSISIGVLQYWREVNGEWVRDASLEMFFAYNDGGTE